MKIFYHIDGIVYEESKERKIIPGDLVIDTQDNLYGYCDSVFGDFISMKEDDVVEIGIPMSRVIKLIPSTETNSLN